MLRNLIESKFELTQDNWVLSILRRDGGDHAFLIIEGLDNNNRVVMRAELGHKQRSDTEYDDHYYQIYCSDYSTDEYINYLQTKAAEKKLHYQSFQINHQQKEQLLRTIQHEVMESTRENLTYVKLGNQNSYTGGFFGASVASTSGELSKKSSVEHNHTSRSDNASGGSTHTSVDASLQKGHSCVSWAQEKMQQTCPNYNPSILGQLFITVPQIEVPKNEGGCSLV